MAAIRPVRRPLDGLNPYDVEAIRKYACIRLHDDVLRRGTVTPRLLLLHDDHIAEIDLDHAAGGDPLATFMALATDTLIEQRMLLCSFPAGPGAWIALACGAGNDEERSFWVIYRPFTMLPGGMGSAESSWQLSWGNQLTGVPDMFSFLARPGGAWSVLPAVPPPLPKISYRRQDVPKGAIVPTDAIATVNAAADVNETVAWKKQVEGVMIMVFRQKTLDSYHVVGEIPCGLDDLVRAACAKGETPSAVATMKLDLFAHRGVTTRAVKTMGEAGGMRMERILGLMYEPGDKPNSPTNLQFFACNPTPVGSDGWIGVEPITDIDLYPLGPGASSRG